jgi:hypothetical protein
MPTSRAKTAAKRSATIRCPDMAACRSGRHSAFWAPPSARAGASNDPSPA